MSQNPQDFTQGGGAAVQEQEQSAILPEIEKKKGEFMALETEKLLEYARKALPLSPALEDKPEQLQVYLNRLESLNKEQLVRLVMTLMSERKQQEALYAPWFDEIKKTGEKFKHELHTLEKKADRLEVRVQEMQHQDEAEETAEDLLSQL